MATTTAPSATYRIFAHVAPYLKTVRMGGVVGDAKHGSGYHLSRNALKARGLSADYSIQCAADKDGGGSYASAIDLTFNSLSELITVTKRLRAACTPDKDGNYDPRIEPLREHIGTVDGKNVCGYNRVATGSGTRSRVGWTATKFSDSSHLWHAHLSILRRYNNIENDMLGIAEVVAGLPAGALGWKDPDASAPAPSKPSSPAPVVTDGDPAPIEKVVISLKDVQKAFKLDGDRPQGGTTPGSVEDVKPVEWALYKAKLLDKKYAEDGAAGTLTVAAYKKWQRKLGYRGKDADGIPGIVSLRKLGEKYGFEVAA